jgi:hypothetical protein
VSRIKILSAILATSLMSIASVRMTSAAPLVFTGNRSGDALGGAVACSRASVGSHRRSLIAATAPGHSSGRGAVIIYDPEAKQGGARKLKMGPSHAGCKFGSSVSFVSDANGDGVDELIASASCSEDNGQESFLIFQSVRKGAKIGFTLCGTKVGEKGIARIARHRDGFLVTRVGNDASSLHGIFMRSSKECSVATATDTSRVASDANQVGGCAVGSSGACVVSRGCQAHIDGRLRAFEVRGMPHWKNGVGLIEARTRSSLAMAAYSTVSDSDQISMPAETEPATPTIVDTPESPPSVVNVPGSVIPLAQGVVVAPGSARLPAPEVFFSNPNMANVILPEVSVRLTEAQRDRALRLLLNRGSSKQKAEKALENPKNFITTYIVTIVAEGRAAAAQAVVLKARMAYARGATQMRKLRTRRSRVSVGRLTPGTTYSVSYRVEISLKKPRTVLGVTKSSQASRVRVP